MAKKNKGPQQQKFDLGSKIGNIQILLHSNRRKEAIAYIFMLYQMMCAAKFKQPKFPSQSIRDYAMVMIKNHGQNPRNVYPFIESVESVIYGGKQPSQSMYKKSVESFAPVFKDVSGKDLPTDRFF